MQFDVTAPPDCLAGANKPMKEPETAPTWGETIGNNIFLSSVGDDFRVTRSAVAHIDCRSRWPASSHLTHRTPPATLPLRVRLRYPLVHMYPASDTTLLTLLDSFRMERSICQCAFPPAEKVLCPTPHVDPSTMNSGRQPSCTTMNVDRAAPDHLTSRSGLCLFVLHRRYVQIRNRVCL